MTKKGFTLIELLAVLVILAIIALITIPIVIRTINNSEENAEKQSILGYARVIEDDIANYILDPVNNYDKYNNNINDLDDNDDSNNRLKTLNYKGTEVKCSTHNVSSEGKLTLTCCKVVGGTGTGYNYENGKVEKSTDTSCNVKDDSDDNQSNGNNENNNKTYDIGKELTVEGVKYNVIGQGSDYVTLLKQEPLTVAEVNDNKIGKDGENHVNRYINPLDKGKAIDINDYGYGGVAFYSSSTCGCSDGNIKDNSCTYVTTECTTDYEKSDVKYVVDTWADNTFKNGELKKVNGYNARLLNSEELHIFHPNCEFNVPWCSQENDSLDWLYYPTVITYWTMAQYQKDENELWIKYYGQGISQFRVYFSAPAVRPVINVYKSKIY